MITVRTNIGQITSRIISRLNSLKDSDQLLRTVANDMLGEVHSRIHTQGLATDERPIGEYSEAYMKVRTGNFGNSARVSRGKNKGAVKDAGLFTRGDKKGQSRPKYNRTADTKVVISLTRQMENDFSVIATEKGYGLGYKNIENAKKVGYVETTYNRKIFGLTASEKEKVKKVAREFVKQKLSGTT